MRWDEDRHGEENLKTLRSNLLRSQDDVVSAAQGAWNQGEHGRVNLVVDFIHPQSYAPPRFGKGSGRGGSGPFFGMGVRRYNPYPSHNTHNTQKGRLCSSPFDPPVHILGPFIPPNKPIGDQENVLRNLGGISMDNSSNWWCNDLVAEKGLFTVQEEMGDIVMEEGAWVSPPASPFLSDEEILVQQNLSLRSPSLSPIKTSDFSGKGTKITIKEKVVIGMPKSFYPALTKDKKVKEVPEPDYPAPSPEDVENWRMKCGKYERLGAVPPSLRSYMKHVQFERLTADVSTDSSAMPRRARATTKGTRMMPEVEERVRKSKKLKDSKKVTVERGRSVRE